VTKLTWLRSWFVPVIIALFLCVVFVGYYLYWVPNRQRHLDDRGFRYLKTLSDQIRLTINTYDKMLDNAVDSGGVTTKSGAVNDGNLKQYLGLVSPELVVPERSETVHIIGSDYDDPPKIAVQADEGTHFLYLAFRHSENAKLVVRTDLDKLIDGLLGPPDLSPFDVVLLAQSNGNVIFQKSLSGIEVARIENLQDDSGVVDGKNPKQIGVQLLTPVSRLEEVKIAGARYRLYSQPLQISFLPADPGRKPAQENSKGNIAKGQSETRSTKEASEPKSGPSTPAAKSPEDPSAPWVLCGLVRADRFRTESQLIPYAYILIVLAAMLLALAAYPFLRLHLSSPGERLRSRDVTTIAVFACLVTAILTFTLVDAYYLKYFFGQAADEEMRRLAVAINLNFERERFNAFAQLDALNMRHELTGAIDSVRHDLRSSPDKEDVILLFGEHSDMGCDPNPACRMNILGTRTLPPADNDAATFEYYPYLFFAAWSDVNGKQLVKWTTRTRPTPFISLNDASVPYYTAVKRALKDRGIPRTVPASGIGSQYSPTTGQNITIFWRVIPEENKKAATPEEEQENDSKKFSASIVTQPISLFNPVLPGGYQFAVLEPDGTVVFHSDSARNLRENFFAETDKDPDLRSRVRMRTEGTVVADYIGRPHRMYVLPMAHGNQDGLWTVVVFRDLHPEETMNLEILSLVSTLFLFYAAAITIILVSAYWIRRDQAARVWLWPDSRKADRYWWMLAANSTAAVVLLALSRLVHKPLVFLPYAGLIPAAVLVLNLVVLAGRSDLQEPSDQPEGTTSTRWQFAYCGACTTLLAVIALLPCLCFFKVVCNFENKLFVQHTQLQLASDLESRELKMQKLYQETTLDDYYRNLVFSPPGAQNARRILTEPTVPARPLIQPVYSYHEILEINICSGESPEEKNDVSVNADLLDAELTIPTCSTDTAHKDENPFLSDISFSYNEGAADDRHLAEGKSDVWAWMSSGSSRGGSRRITMKANAKEKGDQDGKTGQGRKNGKGLIIASLWTPFHFPWDHALWWFGTVVVLAVLYALVRSSLNRVFLLELLAPPPAKDAISGLSPATLMSNLPMNLLIIGHESSRPIASLIGRSDVQLCDAEILLKPAPAPAKPGGWFRASRSSGDQIDGVIRNGSPVVLHNFDRLPDDPESSAKANMSLLRLLSGLGNSVIIISEIDPLAISSIEASERWRSVLRSFVRIDLHSTLGQRIGEEDADYQNRLSADSYFHWLFSGLSKSEKLVMMQLAQEGVVNPNSADVIADLMAQGLIERRWGLLMVKDNKFAKFLVHALPHHTVKHWEKEIAGSRPASLQWSFLVLGVGVVAFLIYTQGEVFNTWVTYATGVAAAAPKILQFLSSVRPKSEAKT